MSLLVLQSKERARKREKMKDGPAFQTYASDYYIDTNSWTVDEVGIYQRLLLTEWANGGLPKDEIRLARIAGCSLKKFQKGWRVVSKKFQNGNFWNSKEGLSIEVDRSSLESDKLYNPRLEIVRENQRKYKELQSQKGKISVEVRRSRGLNRGLNRGLTDALTESQPSSSSSSSSLNKDLKEGEDTPFNLPKKEEIEEGSDLMILGLVEKVCFQLYKLKIFPEVNSFKNKMIKEKKNPRSILHTLCRAYIRREFDEGPWAYCQKIIEIEDKKYNARDYGKTS